MSYRGDMQTRTYDASQLQELVHRRDIMVNVGGIDIHVEDLAKAGWTCRITYNIYGGRTKVVFKSGDQRSSMVFRVDRTRTQYLSAKNDFELLKRISEGTLNIVPKVLVQQKVVEKQVEVVKEVITEEATDLELLNRVNENIKKRLAGRLKKTTPKPAASMVA